MALEKAILTTLDTTTRLRRTRARSMRLRNLTQFQRLTPSTSKRSKDQKNPAPKARGFAFLKVKLISA